MSALRYWAFNIPGDAIIFGSLALWVVNGDPGALNVFLVFGWLCAGCAIFIGLFAGDTKAPVRPTGATPYQWASHAAFVVLAAWFGFLALAACYGIGAMLVESWHHRTTEAAA